MFLKILFHMHFFLIFILFCCMIILLFLFLRNYVCFNYFFPFLLYLYSTDMLPLVRTTRKGSCDVRSLSGESMCTYTIILKFFTLNATQSCWYFLYFFSWCFLYGLFFLISQLNTLHKCNLNEHFLWTFLLYFAL